jgi:hypothetical protein
MSNFYLRTESIKQEDILSLSVINGSDKDIISALLSPEPCLLEGSRGTGKSFLMRVAELKIEQEKKACIPVYVSFNISSLINTSDNLQFYHWMLAKTLKGLLNTLRKKGLVVSTHSASLLSNDERENDGEIEKDLREIVKNFENSYKGNSNIDLDTLPDIEDVKDAIELICKDNKLERIYFFFDEAAHVFRPEQQRQFFSLFKDLRSPYITCNAAIYPGVTYFGDSFEPIHDCIFKKLDRNIKDPDYIEYFKNIVLNQAEPGLRDAINNNISLFITLALSSGGNPRILLKTIQDLLKFNQTSVNQLIKEFYRGQIWAEHTELGEKYKGHKVLIDWGRDFLENYVIPAIEKYNANRKDKNLGESTIYFWIHKDAPETVKESLRLLTYTGVIRKLDSSVRATRAELGNRYEVKYGCIIALQSSPVAESQPFFESLSIKKFPEFGKNHSSYDAIRELSNTVEDEVSFKESLENMLKKPISVLQLLTNWQKEKLNNAGIHTLENLHTNTETDLIEKIYNVGPVRARLMKNAANAELLEYLSG